jgi:hypothetical protein
MSKKETLLPTVATEGLLLACTVDMVDGGDVATWDIPGAFMQSNMKGKVVMKLQGVMAKAILKIDPKQYSRHTVKENGKDVIYVILKKALYVTLQAALLFWQNLQPSSRNGTSKLTPTTSVWQIRPSTARNA